MIIWKRSLMIIAYLLVVHISPVKSTPLPSESSVDHIAEQPLNTDIEHEMESIQSELRSVLTDLTKRQQYSSDLLNRGFSLVGKWTCLYLQRHPDVSADKLVEALEALNMAPEPVDKYDDRYTLYRTVVQLATGEQAAYVIAPALGPIGSFFIIARTSPTTFDVVWDMKEVAAAHYAARDELGYWAYLGESYVDGPLSGDVYPLSPSASGHPRFYVDAITNSHFGGIRPAQISIWEWNGREPIPLLIKSYQICIHSYHVEREGNALHLMTRGDFKTFFLTGQSPIPQVLWTLHITPEGVTDGGRQDLEPELMLIDDVFYRMMRREDVSDIASFSVAQKLMNIIPEQKEPTETGYLLGELVRGYTAMHKEDHDVFVLKLDWEHELVFEFTIIRKNEHQYISDIQFLDELPDKN